MIPFLSIFKALRLVELPIYVLSGMFTVNCALWNTIKNSRKIQIILIFYVFR